MWKYNYTDELYHYGVPGMKWGVRRAQKRVVRVQSKSEKGDWSSDATETAKIKAKGMQRMSNSELRKLNERQQLEQTHKQLNPSAIKKGVAFVAAASVATSSVITLAKNSRKIYDAGKTVARKIIDKVGGHVARDLARGLREVPLRR